MLDGAPDQDKPNTLLTRLNWRETGLVWLWLSVAIIALDQLTKLWAVSVLSSYEPVPVIPFLNMTLAFNTGAAFSFLGDAGGWQDRGSTSKSRFPTLGCVRRLEFRRF